MKKIGISLFILVVFGLGGTFYFQSWISKRIPEIINSNPDRNYDLLFDDIEIHFFKGQMELGTIMLVPLNDSLSTKMNGSLRRIQMMGVNFKELIFNRKLEIGEIKLIEPAFRLIQKSNRSNANESSKAFQGLFQDLISRGEIKNFILERGTAEMFLDKDSLYRFGQFTDLSIVAQGIETDSIIATYAIPFKLESISTSLKNLKIVTDFNQEFRLAEANYNSEKNEASFKNLSLTYTNLLSEVIVNSEYQKDILEVTVKEFKLNHINAKSTIYNNWFILAGMASIDSLVLEDLRDKNKPRPIESIKPLFEEMVESIPIPIKIDSIKVINSTITYKEIPEGKKDPITLNFQRINGDITNLISIDSLQNFGTLAVNVSSSLNGFAPLEMNIDVPYGTNSFELNANLGGFNLTSLNEVFKPMGKFQIESGVLKGLKLHMRADEKGSANTLNFDYENLRLQVLNSEDSKKGKNGLLTTVVNLMTSKENLPSSKNYKVSKHWTPRNPYRAPFNLIWISTKDGLMSIVPSGFATILLPEKKP
ncbi:DUF748 domain-containing protein [Algoriphagus sp.]|uniref:DUF748 domain-containing protein n=1 Tax=Algoriphagus sp. TaxID=1872435 RepID=UPI0025DA6D82|nr:DUF748 domain-containing protein [Algoriphagus sp.]